MTVIITPSGLQSVAPTNPFVSTSSSSTPSSSPITVGHTTFYPNGGVSSSPTTSPITGQTTGGMSYGPSTDSTTTTTTYSNNSSSSNVIPIQSNQILSTQYSPLQLGNYPSGTIINTSTNQVPYAPSSLSQYQSQYGTLTGTSMYLGIQTANVLAPEITSSNINEYYSPSKIFSSGGLVPATGTGGHGTLMMPDTKQFQQNIFDINTATRRGIINFVESAPMVGLSFLGPVGIGIAGAYSFGTGVETLTTPGGKLSIQQNIASLEGAGLPKTISNVVGYSLPVIQIGLGGLGIYSSIESIGTNVLIKNAANINPQLVPGTIVRLSDNTFLQDFTKTQSTSNIKINTFGYSVSTPTEILGGQQVAVVSGTKFLSGKPFVISKGITEIKGSIDMYPSVSGSDITGFKTTPLTENMKFTPSQSIVSYKEFASSNFIKTSTGIKGNINVFTEGKTSTGVYGGLTSPNIGNNFYIAYGGKVNVIELSPPNIPSAPLEITNTFTGGKVGIDVLPPNTKFSFPVTDISIVKQLNEFKVGFESYPNTGLKANVPLNPMTPGTQTLATIPVISAKSISILPRLTSSNTFSGITSPTGLIESNYPTYVGGTSIVSTSLQSSASLRQNLISPVLTMQIPKMNTQFQNTFQNNFANTIQNNNQIYSSLNTQFQITIQTNAPFLTQSNIPSLTSPQITTQIQPPINPKPNIPISPNIPIPFNLKISMGDNSFGSIRNFGAKRITKYTPDFGSLFFNVHGKYKPGRLSKSGLDIRKITKGFSFKTGLESPNILQGGINNMPKKKKKK
jgi:hypothetical protein